MCSANAYFDLYFHNLSLLSITTILSKGCIFHHITYYILHYYILNTRSTLSCPIRHVTLNLSLKDCSNLLPRALTIKSKHSCPRFPLCIHNDICGNNWPQIRVTRKFNKLHHLPSSSLDRMPTAS